MYCGGAIRQRIREHAGQFPPGYGQSPAYVRQLEVQLKSNSVQSLRHAINVSC